MRIWVASSKGMDFEMLFFVVIYQCDFATRWRKVGKGENKVYDGMECVRRI